MAQHERECPSCGWPAPAGSGPCLHCLTPRPPDPVGVDTLDGAALAVDRLRDFLDGPPTPDERAASRRFLDSLAEDRWRR